MIQGLIDALGNVKGVVVRHKVIAWGLGSYLVSIFFCAGFYSLAADQKCTLVNSLFFAVQTFTTTGYGSGVDVSNDGVQCVAIVSMLIGTLAWAVLITVAASRVHDWVASVPKSNELVASPQTSTSADAPRATSKEG